MKNGEWICGSLHLVNKIYNAQIKMKWVKGGVHGVQKAVDPTIQCSFITKKGSRCVRSECSAGGVCAQHFKVS